MPKNRPETFRSNKQTDVMKSLSYYRAPTIAGKYIIPETNRQMSIQMFHVELFATMLHNSWLRY